MTQKGVLYKEVLCDVCDKMRVKYNKKSSVETIEHDLLLKILSDSLEKMSHDDLEELGRNLSKVYGHPNRSYRVAITAAWTLIDVGGAAYRVTIPASCR